MKQLICVRVNGMRIRQSLPQPYIPWTETLVLWKVQWLGAEVYGLWSNPRARAAVDWRDGLRGCEGGDLGGKCQWRKARQSWKQGDTAESRVGGGATTIGSLPPHSSISSWTRERLAHQTPDALNYRVGPQPGGHLYVPDMLNNREGPKQGSLLSSWMGGAMKKNWQRGHLIASYKRL